ncbi:MAG: Opacity protein [Candidatus Electronema aureum]|uniref:Opacity protein n=1 Tax=Candidatus Electronema aureum TaxID=2005002 RepID=A0A521G1Y2_9BACT|nr:MAG: Opacity protein [Candidatus Electronema aureum]
MLKRFGNDRTIRIKGENMKKIMSAAVASVLLFAAAGYSIAGSKYAPPKGPAEEGCSGDCQDQIDGLNSSQARQDEQINALQADQGRQDQQINALESGQGRQDEQIMANSARLDQHDNEINALKTRKTDEYNPWYVKGVARMIWSGSMDVDKAEYGFTGETDTGYGIGLAGGRRFGNFRAEGELAAQTSDFSTKGLSDIAIKTMMLNGFYHVPVPAFGIFGNNCNALSVYGMAGMGAGKAEVTFENDDEDSDTGFAYKVGAGVAYDIAANMAVDVGYEYMRTSAIELGNDDHMMFNDVKNSSFNAALRYSF